MGSQVREAAKAITIDEDPYEIDDALWIEKGKSGYLVSVSIADAAAAIPKGSDVDKAAYELAFSRYRTDKVVPMIPSDLLNGRLSLLPDEERAAITISVEITRNLRIHEPVFKKTMLKNIRQLSITEAGEILMDPSRELHSVLSNLNVLARLLYSRRNGPGELQAYDLDRAWKWDDRGGPAKPVFRKPGYANIIVQEFMVLASVLVASHFDRSGQPFIYRNHCGSSFFYKMNLMKYCPELGPNPSKSQLRKARKSLSYLAQATYGPRNLSHFGLNLPAYTHITSPLRRYADLVNHRLLSAYLDNMPPPYSVGELADISYYIRYVENHLRRIARFVDDSSLAEQAV